MNGISKDACGTFRLHTSIAEQSDVPKSIRAWTLFSRPRVALEAIHGGGVLFKIPRCKVNFDGRSANSEIIRIQRGLVQPVEAVIELDFSPPAIHPLCDLFVGSSEVIDRTLKKQLGLRLWRHLIEDFDLVLGKHIGRDHLW